MQKSTIQTHSFSKNPKFWKSIQGAKTYGSIKLEIFSKNLEMWDFSYGKSPIIAPKLSWTARNWKIMIFRLAFNFTELPHNVDTRHFDHIFDV